MSYPKVIYAIQHNKTKRFYIGSTGNIQERYKQHMFFLRRGKHSSILMQDDYNKYGEDYSVIVLGEIYSFLESYKEYQQMIKYVSFCPKYGYNQGEFKHCSTFIRKESITLKTKDNLEILNNHQRFYRG